MEVRLDEARRAREIARVDRFNERAKRSVAAGGQLSTELSSEAKVLGCLFRIILLAGAGPIAEDLCFPPNSGALSVATCERARGARIGRKALVVALESGIEIFFWNEIFDMRACLARPAARGIDDEIGLPRVASKIAKPERFDRQRAVEARLRQSRISAQRGIDRHQRLRQARGFAFSDGDQVLRGAKIVEDVRIGIFSERLQSCNSRARIALEYLRQRCGVENGRRSISLADSRTR